LNESDYKSPLWVHSFDIILLLGGVAAVVVCSRWQSERSKFGESGKNPDGKLISFNAYRVIFTSRLLHQIIVYFLKAPRWYASFVHGGW